jgi:hypothetical protein
MVVARKLPLRLLCARKVNPAICTFIAFSSPSRSCSPFPFSTCTFKQLVWMPWEYVRILAFAIGYVARLVMLPPVSPSLPFLLWISAVGRQDDTRDTPEFGVGIRGERIRKTYIILKRSPCKPFVTMRVESPRPNKPRTPSCLMTILAESTIESLSGCVCLTVCARAKR